MKQVVFFGSIGVGKTTAGNILESKFQNVQFLKEDLDEIASRFIDGVEVYALIDTLGILREKESPTDNIEKFERLLTECIYKLK